MNKTYTWIIIVILVVLASGVAYSMLTMPDKRTTIEKVSDAINDMPQGAKKVGRDLEDRTPGQKLGDAIKDAGDKVKDNTAAQPTQPATTP